MVVFWSPLDVFVLGLGTRVFGTIDRVRSVSAGLVGFRGGPGEAPAGPLAAGDGEDGVSRRARRAG